MQKTHHDNIIAEKKHQIPCKNRVERRKKRERNKEKGKKKRKKPTTEFSRSTAFVRPPAPLFAGPPRLVLDYHLHQSSQLGPALFHAPKGTAQDAHLASAILGAVDAPYPGALQQRRAQQRVAKHAVVVGVDGARDVPQEGDHVVDSANAALHAVVAAAAVEKDGAGVDDAAEQENGGQLLGRDAHHGPVRLGRVEQETGQGDVELFAGGGGRHRPLEGQDPAQEHGQLAQVLIGVSGRRGVWRQQRGRVARERVDDHPLHLLLFDWLA